MFKRITLSALMLGAIAAAQPAFADHHLMQIEQVIGGVNGDTSRQAVQLRMRFAGQNVVSSGQIVAWDAAGANPVVLLNISSNVPVGTAGARVVIATSNFLPGFTPDFVMALPIPPTYLPAGKITFESDGAPGTTIWWGLAWGGAAYTGTNNGIATPVGNDADGNFNPPVNGPLPSTTTQALRFTGAAGALSTTNLADYAVTPGAAVFTKNDGSSGTVPVELMDFKVQ